MNKLTELVKGNKKAVAGGGIVALLAAAIMSVSGCVVTYNHKIIGADVIQLEESYRVELMTDDFVIKMKELEAK